MSDWRKVWNPAYMPTWWYYISMLGLGLSVGAFIARMFGMWP